MDAVAPLIAVLLFLHWYVGVPPLAAVAVNVTLVPEQILPDGFEAIVTAGATAAVTATVAELLVPLPHVFVGVTVTFPPVDPNVTVIAFVFVPAVIVAPVGPAQV